MLTPATPVTGNYSHKVDLFKGKSSTSYIATDRAINDSALVASPPHFLQNAKAKTGHDGIGLSYPSPVPSMRNLQIYCRDTSVEHQNNPPGYAASSGTSSQVAAPPSIDNQSPITQRDKTPNGGSSVGIWQKGYSLRVSHSLDNTQLEWVTEGGAEAERGYEDEDDEDKDQDEDELGEDDDTMEACSNGTGSRINTRISSASLEVDNIQSHVSGRGEKGGGGGLSAPRKRSAPLGFAGNSGNDIRDGDGSSEKPSKRPKEHKGVKEVLHHQAKRPFACPYFKKNPLKYMDCADWRNTKLSLVKTHCMSEHLKSRCPRCKIYRGIQSEIVKHLEDEDCKKPETYDSFEERTTEEKVQELNKAKTWRRIYEILFPLYVPDQCKSTSYDIPYVLYLKSRGIVWQNTIEALGAPNDEDELSFMDRVQLAVSIREQTYRVAIAEFLRDRAGAGAIDELLDQFDKALESKTWNQGSLDGLDNSRITIHDTQIHWSLQKESQKADRSSTSSLIHDPTTLKNETQSKTPTSAGKDDIEQHLHEITTLNHFPNQSQYSVEHLVPAQGPTNSQVDVSSLSVFQQDLLGQSFTNDLSSQDMHDYVNVDDDMFEYGGDEAFEDIAEDFLEPGGMGYSL